VLILVWCPYVASASLFSTSFDKIEESQSTTSSRNIIIDSSIESDSHTDPLTRYLEEDNGGNRQIMLLGSLIVCFLMVAFCCSRIVLSVRNQAELVASSESIREATNANLSLDQRRAILKMLFNDDTKFADTKSGKGKGVATQDDYHDTTMDEREGDNVKGVSGDEESPDTPLTQDMTWFPPGGSQHMVTKEDDASPVKSSLQVLVKNSKAAAVVVPDTALPFARPLSALYADTDSDVEKQDCDVDVTKAETNVDDDVDSIEGDLCSICLGVYGKRIDTVVCTVYCIYAPIPVQQFHFQFFMKLCDLN